MKSMNRATVAAVLASATAFAYAQAVLDGSGKTYPAKEILIVSPYAPGAGADFVTRLLAQKLSVNLGRQVVVENRSGAGAIIGMSYAARGVPDGYTLVLGLSAAFAVNPSLHSNLSYDPVKDFAPIILLTGNPQFLTVHPSLPAKTTKELLVLAKARKGQLSYATAGIGSPAHLAGEALKAMSGVDITHVPYKGAGIAITDLITGRVQLSFMGWVPLNPHVKTGKLRVLGVTSAKPLAMLPDVPPIAETIPGYDFSLWYGVAAPAGTPPEIVAKLNTEILRVLADPDFRQRIQTQAMEPLGSSPAQFGDFIKSEIIKWGKIVKESGATAK